MSDFEQERNEYQRKVGKQKEAIENLLELSAKHTGLFDYKVIGQLKDYKLKCEKLYHKLEKNEFEIAIVGLEKAGKSTFGNALMENRILPDADERCTYTSTCIRFGNDRAVVKFFNAVEMDRVLRGYLDVLGVEHTESYTYKGLTKSEYLSIYGKLAERDREFYKNTVNQDIINLLDHKNDILNLYVGQPDKIFKGEELYKDTFKAYIVSPAVAVAVKEVCIESSRLGKMPNAVIYDVPGFDSPTSMHLEQTKERMKEADAIMLIASAARPSFTAPALNMFQEVVDEDNVSLSDKLFIFGNRADDANTLSKNIETLKRESAKWNLLSSECLEERLLIGSAKAHLQKLGILEGDDCVRKIEESKEYQNAWNYGDGIEYAYGKLVDYNQFERFPLIKKKIRKNNEGLRMIFKELKEQYCDEGFQVDYSELITGITVLKRNAKKEIQKELEVMRNNIRKKYKDELVLSKRLQNEITKLFEDDEKYFINEADIENAELKIIDISGSTNVEKVEELIREEKFNQIYEDFSKSAFAVAQNDHAEYYRATVQCIENALNINKKSSNYDELHHRVLQFLEKYKKNEEDEFIYQSVIERFVRDVMEVLIYRPYSSEARLNKFVDEAEVFSGLVMFYNPGDANEGYKRQFLSVAPKNQPLLLALVFHDYKNADEGSREALNHIGNVCRSLCENPEVIQLAFSIIKRDPLGGADAIRKIVTKDVCKGCKTEDEYTRKVIPELRRLKSNLASEGINEKDNSTKKYDFDFTDSKTFKQQYKQYFGNKEVREYKDVCGFFQDDLEVLRRFLIHASIPAIRLEKPFVSREIQSINKLLSAIDSEEFDKLIDSNAKLLLPVVHESINIAMANSFANKAAIDEVEKIMKTLDREE